MLIAWASKHRAAIAGISLLGMSILCAWAATYSASYEICKAERADNASDEKKADFNHKIANFLVCEGVTLDDNADIVTAVATAFMAIFTLTLWRTSAEQASLTRDFINLARTEFNVTQRPILYIRNLTLADEWKRAPTAPGIEVTGRFIIANKGGTVATIIAGHLEICWSDAGVPTEFIYDTDHPTETIETRVPPGKFHRVDFKSGSISIMKGATGIIEDTSHGSTTILGRVATVGYFLHGDVPPTLYVLGWLRFRGESGITYQMGFCRKWNNRERAFQPVNDPDFDYAA